MLNKIPRSVRAIKDYFVFFEWRLQKRPILYSILATLVAICPVFVDLLAPRDWGNWAFLSPVFATAIVVLGFLERSLTTYGPKRIDFRPNSKLKELTKTVKPSELEEAAGFETVPPKNGAIGSITYSPDFNAKFICSEDWDPQLTKHAKSERYRNIIVAIRQNAREFRALGFRTFLGSLAPNRKALINEKKIGLMTDILPETEVVEVYQTDYFSDMCLVTNGLKDIWELHDHEERIADDAMLRRMPYTNTSSGELRLREFSISSPPLSLHIGVEVLALSKDLLFRIPLQGRGVQYSQGMRAPYASGSLDWEDCESAKTLKESILIGAKRELEEEWGGKGKVPRVDAMAVIGYFRHGERGGKPQFVCIARLGDDDADIWPDTTENYRGERPIQTASITALDEEVDRLLSEQFNNQDSVALYGALLCLKGILRDRPQFVADKLFGTA